MSGKFCYPLILGVTRFGHALTGRPNSHRRIGSKIPTRFLSLFPYVMLLPHTDIYLV
jgi:hypothetical protein